MITIQGMTVQEFQILIHDTVKSVISEYEQKKIAPLSKAEAYRQLGINPRTLDKVMDEMGLKDIYPSDINRILVRYPKYIKKAKAA